MAAFLHDQSRHYSEHGYPGWRGGRFSSGSQEPWSASRAGWGGWGTSWERPSDWQEDDIPLLWDAADAAPAQEAVEHGELLDLLTPLDASHSAAEDASAVPPASIEASSSDAAWLAAPPVPPAAGASDKACTEAPARGA